MRRVEFGVLTVLNTLIKEIARDDDLIGTLKGLEKKKLIPFQTSTTASTTKFQYDLGLSFSIAK